MFNKGYRPVLHIGIYLGDGTFVHVMNGRKVEISRLKIYKKYLIKILRAIKNEKV